jgi:hypothetical protein
MRVLPNVEHELLQSRNSCPNMQEISFHQWTSKGNVFCRVTVPMGICTECGARNWDKSAAAIIEEAVKREVDKLP